MSGTEYEPNYVWVRSFFWALLEPQLPILSLTQLREIFYWQIFVIQYNGIQTDEIRF
jgi:hypothetical protein